MTTVTLSAVCNEGLDEPEAQASAAAGHHDRLVLEASFACSCVS